MSFDINQFGVGWAVGPAPLIVAIFSTQEDAEQGLYIAHYFESKLICQHDFVNLIGGPACRKCGWTP